MNTLDMYTREKANTIHLKKMHHDAKERRLLHKARQDRNLEGAGARWPMNTKYLFILLILLISLLVSGCASSAPANPADRFTGTWSGTMSFTDDANRKEDIIVSIPAGCTAGSICGDINNTTVSCQ